MPWFSPGKLQTWTRWLQQQHQEIGCDLVELFVSKEVKAGEGKALLLRSSVSSACGAPDGSHGLEEPAATAPFPDGKSSFV